MEFENSKDIFAFDSRPIYLNDVKDVVSYVRHRYLLASRQAFWKVLRLRKYPRWESEEIKNNYDNARTLVEENDWLDEVKKIRNNFCVYVPKFDLAKQDKDGKFISSLKCSVPDSRYCSNGQLGEEIADLLDRLRVPYSFCA